MCDTKSEEEPVGQSGELFQKIFEEGPLGMALIGLDFGFVKVNARFCQMLGYSEQELLGLSFPQITHPEDRDTDTRQAREMAQGKIPFYNIDKRYIKKNGEPLWVRLTRSLLHNQAGQPLCYLTKVEDISHAVEMEAALRESEQKFRSVIESANDAIILIDEQAKVVSWNKGAQAIFGYSEAEMRGQSLDFLIPEEYREAHQQGIQRLRAGGAERLMGETLELAGLRRDGSQFPLELSLSSWQQGTHTFYSSIIRDISERKKAESALRQQADLLDFAHNAIFVRDLRGRITFWNNGAVKKYGWTKEEALGQMSHELLKTQFPQPLHEIEEQIFRTGQWNGELIHSRRDGSLLVVESRWAPQRDAQGQIIAFLEINSDITARKKAEEANLRAQREAEKANAAKSEFLSRMSHELRTPLNAILGFAQLLELEPLNEEQADNVQQILKGGEHLLGLINEVLDIARIEAGHLSLSLEPVLVEHTLDEVIALLRPVAQKSGIALRFNFAEMAQTSVYADQQRLKQVLLNLVSNAIKYNRKGGSATVDYDILSPEILRIQVSDTGRGIAAHEIERLFLPFERLDAEQTEVEGSGLGLALSKHLIEAMNGRIGVQSTPGEGSTFWIELPLAVQSDDIAKEDEHPNGQSLQNVPGTRTLLYIDDNAANLRLLERIVVRRPGVKVVAARDGLEGIDLARRCHPDLILLDIHLPDLQGDEVLRRLKSHSRTQYIPIVMLSADETPGYAAHLIAQGACAYLAKPVQPGKFLSLLDETLNQQNREPN